MLPILIVVVLAVHLVAVNVASAGPLVCVWLEVRSWRHGEPFHAAGKRMAWASLSALLLGIFLGLVLLAIYWLEQTGAYWAALARFPSKAFLFASAELVFSLVLMTICVAFWSRRPRSAWLRVCLATLAGLASTNLIYHFPPLMTAISELAVHPELVIEDTVSRSMILEVMARPDVFALSIHFVVASVAVAGVALMHIGQSLAGNSEGYQAVVVSGGRIALFPTLLQLLIGIWVLVRLPQSTVVALIGGDVLASILFGISVAGTFGLLHSLAGVSLGETDGPRVRRASLLLLMIIVAMVGTLLRSRHLV